jgi:hypothetical protein
VGHLLGVVLPLAFGAAVSPTVLAVQLVMLSGRQAPLKRAWAVAAACMLVLVVFGVVALLVAGATTKSHKSDAGAIVKLVAAGLLVALGVRGLLKPPRPPKPHRDSAHPVRGAFLLGIGLMLTNFSSIVLFFPAMHEIGISDVAFGDKALVTALLFVIALLPATGPPLVVTLMGPRATPLLERLNRFFTDHRREIAAGLCFVFAALLTAAGVGKLV